MSKYYEDLPLKVVRKNIFEAEGKEKPKAPEPAPKLAVKKTDRARFAKLATNVRGLAESNPDSLLSALKVSGFKPNPTLSKQDKIFEFLRHTFSIENEPGELYWIYLFDNPVKNGNNIVIPIAQLESSEDEKVSPPKTTCTSFISSLLYAAATSSDKKIDWSEEDDLAITSYRGKQASVVLKIGR
jgi:hypothetical protein